MTLTEQWKNNGLEEYKKYYCKTEGFEDIFQARCYDKDTKGEWWALENAKYRYNNIFHTKKDIEVLAPVPSYEEYLALQSDSLAKNEAEEIIAELENRMNLERQLYKSVLDENTKLKNLLKECMPYVTRNVVFTTVNRGEVVDLEKNELLTKIDEVLK